MASVAKRKWTHKGEVREAWVVRYMEGGKHRSKQFDKKKDADAFRQKVEREISDGVHVPATSSATFRQLAEDYMRAEEMRLNDGRVGRGHYKNVRTIMVNSVIPQLGGRLVKDFTANDVEGWYNQLVKVQGLKPWTAKYRILFCNSLFDFAIRRGFTKVNPLAEGKRLLRGINMVPIRTFSVAQVGDILRAANERRAYGHNRVRDMARCLVHLAAFCGLRWGEIVGLPVDRVNFDTRVIEVRHSLTAFDEMKAPKTKAGVRDVPMPPHIAVLLRDWIDQWYVPNDRGLLFRTLERKIVVAGRRFDGMILPANWRKSVWCPMLERAGIEVDEDDVPHFHALRHFASSWMIANGIPLKDTASLLGHKQFDTTLQIYNHDVTTKSERSIAFDAMADRLLAGPVVAT